MSTKTLAFVVPCLVLGASLCAFAQEKGGGKKGVDAQSSTTRSEIPDNPQSQAHIDAAKKMAGNDPTLNTVYNFFCTVTNFNAPGAELEATKVFDNLYAIPSSTIQQTTAWAITTSDGIIMIDSGQEGRTQAILEGLKKVGLDPAKVKYILLGHGHGDHYAGAGYFQEHYGTRVATTEADWNLMYPPNKAAPKNDNRPRRDMVIKEGEDVKLGDETVHIIEIPGHTPGSVGFIFNVKDNGKTHVAGMFGGTILGQARIPTAGLEQYIHSIDHYLEYAKKMKVDVEIQNHALFDDTPGRLAKLKARKPGEPNPFIMKTDEYVKFWHVVSECIRAEIVRRPADFK